MKSRTIIAIVFACYIVLGSGYLIFISIPKQQQQQQNEIKPLVIGIPILDLNNITGFGSRWGTLINFGGSIGWKPHQGIDLNLLDNTYVIAGHDGVISGIWIGDYGNKYQVQIRINNTWEITHIFEPFDTMTIQEMEESVFVEVNQYITKGQIIGILRGGGGHVHWDVMRRNETGPEYLYYRTNPAFYLNESDYIILNNLFHQKVSRPVFHDRIHDLVMFNNPLDWNVPKLVDPLKDLMNASSLRPFGVPNPKNESNPHEVKHEDLDYNITGKTRIIAPFAGNITNIQANSTLHSLKVDIMLNPSFWLRFELITNDFLTDEQLLGLVNQSISMGTHIQQNQTIITTPLNGAILHFSLARYNHTKRILNPNLYDWDNPVWYFDYNAATNLNNFYQTHDLEDWHSKGFNTIY